MRDSNEAAAQAPVVRSRPRLAEEKQTRELKAEVALHRHLYREAFQIIQAQAGPMLQKMIVPSFPKHASSI